MQILRNSNLLKHLAYPVKNKYALRYRRWDCPTLRTLPYLLAYKTPLCGPCETNPSAQGGSYSKGGFICQIYGPSLVSTNPPIRRVDSSYISGASLTFQVLQPTIYLIKGGLICQQNVGTATLRWGGSYMRGGLIAKGGLICQ